MIKKSLLYFLFIFVSGMLGGVLAGQIFFKAPVTVTERQEVKIQENTALQEAVAKVSKSVVGVKTAGSLEGSAMIMTNDGLIVTLSDLLPPGEKFSFWYENAAQSYQVLKRDAQANLALVKMDKGGLSTTGLADFETLKLGQRVFLVGYDFKTNGYLVNEGIIRKLGSGVLQTTIVEKASLQGSPVFDVEGNLVGLAVIGKDGLVSAVPVSEIKAFVGF